MQLSGQKHSKKEYEKLQQWSIYDVVRMTKEEQTRKKFEDESLAQLSNIVKVEKKKTFKKKSRVQ